MRRRAAYHRPRRIAPAGSVVLEGIARYWALIGFVPLFTGLFRFCPAYTLLGVSTCPMTRG